MTTHHDFVFVTDRVDDDVEERLLDAGVEFTISLHDGLNYLTVCVPGDGDPVGAAVACATTLARMGVRVHRADLDLVNQQAIAFLGRVTPQAVFKWVRSTGATKFPTPHTSVSGPLWAWSAVDDWLRRTGKPHDATRPASPLEVEEFNHRWQQVATVPDTESDTAGREARVGELVAQP